MGGPAPARFAPGLSTPTARPLSGPPGRLARPPTILSPAARKALLQKMLFTRQGTLDRIQELTGCSGADLRLYRQELVASDLPDRLLGRGAGSAFVRELPQGVLLYLLVRAMQPRQIVETGVRPGYSTAWMLAALDANRLGELTSLGPGPIVGRAAGVENVAVGQFVPPSLRARWTLVLGNSEDRLRSILAGLHGVDLFFYDNGPDVARARFELKSAWEALSEEGLLLAHHIDANAAWRDACAVQGLPPQVLDPGPPPLGALSMRRGTT